MPKISENTTSGMRIDKWLWCARFYKTRSLAADAVKSGKVMINDERSKPSRLIRSGDNLLIRKGAFHYEITLLQLTRGRKSAADAAQLYTESEESIKQRKILSLQLKATAANTPQSRGRPTKRDRRNIIKFKQEQ